MFRSKKNSAITGAAFLMATSAIGPGFLTQTSVFTGQLMAGFGFVILLSVLLDIGAQLNIWRILAVKEERAPVIANSVVPGLGYLLSVLVAAGGLAFNIGNIGGCGLGLQALTGMDVYTGAFLSGGIALVLFWGLWLMQKPAARIRRQHIPRFMLCAITGVVINQILFIKGVSLTTSIHSALLSLATPIFITLIAAWILRERFTLLNGAGLVLGIGGAAILILLKDSAHGSNMILGDTLVLINAVSYAFYLVWVRPLMKIYSGVQILRWIFTFGAIVIIPFGLPDFMTTNWHQFDASHTLGLVYIAVGATFFAYLFNVYGVGVIGASATGAYIYTQPVFAALVAIFIAGEPPTLVKGLSALLIFGGVYLANYRKTVS